jgi:hypothetical protein
MSKDTSVQIDFTVDELVEITKAMIRLQISSFSQFIDYAIRNAVKIIQEEKE